MTFKYAVWPKCLWHIRLLGTKFVYVASVIKKYSSNCTVLKKNIEKKENEAGYTLTNLFYLFILVI